MIVKMVVSDVLEDSFEFQSTDEFRDRDRLLSIPGMKYVGRHKKFIAPKAWLTCLAARGTFGATLELSDEVIEWATEHRKTFIDPALELRNSLCADGDSRLRPYQRAGVKFLTHTGRAMLLDEMGTGKTIQSLTALRTLVEEGKDALPALIVCPNSMKMTWGAELEKWWPEANVAVLTGTTLNRRKMLTNIGPGPDQTNIVVVNWEALRTFSRLDGKVSRVRLRRCHVCEPTLDSSATQSRCENCRKEMNKITWKTIIADEAHKMKDKDSKQTRALCALRTDETEYRFALTGTPLGNLPNELWPVLHFLYPKDFTSSSKFIDRYCETWTNYWGGTEILGLSSANALEFYNLIDPMFRRMPKDLVLADLPPKQHSTRLVPMDGKQRTTYDRVVKESVALLDKGHVAAIGSLPKQTRLEQLASSYLEEAPDGSIKLANPSNKITAVLEILDECPGESVIVFAQSKQLVDLLAAKLDAEGITYGQIVGGQTDAQRQAYMNDFQAGKTRVMLATIQAGGTGITLTKASIVVFMQLSWSTSDVKQAEDRAHRFGSEHESIQIIDLVSEGTIEVAKQKIVREEKPERIAQVLRDAQFIDFITGREK